MDNKRIWLSLAQMSGHEMKYIQEAFDTNWVAPLGPNVNEFERGLQKYLNQEFHNKHVVALNTGTAALHLGLLQLGIGTGDEVICQSFTFAATANVITYLGATPVFVDSEPDTWNISPELIEKAIQTRLEITGQSPKAIVYVNLYGMPAKIDELIEISKRYNVPLVEDAAESLGSEYRGQKCGTFGDFSAISFNGNKIITTSGGGALVCNSKEIAEKTLFYATQARENEAFYQHREIGYNYRMSNICAGIGRGQLLVLESFVEARKRNHKLYAQLFDNIRGITVHENPNSKFNSNFWLTTILVDSKKFGKTSDEIRLALEKENIESRPLWKPMHMQPVFKGFPAFVNGISQDLFSTGLCLPSGVGLSVPDIEKIVSVILQDYPPYGFNEYNRLKDLKVRVKPEVSTLFLNKKDK
ncbi:MAG: aminotransferase class I/II-fold pyridoxal phosphate-dependent enzyme, partial [Paludibacter sp.]|nr:aminotransferase class I/II-fold pyridoxal phosphate-dependent enzyme [Paludibacter sp.]